MPPSQHDHPGAGQRGERAPGARHRGNRPMPNPVAEPASRAGQAARASVQSGSRTVATACAAMPSPRPVKPSFSVVVALTLTRSARDAEDLGDALDHRGAMRRDLRPLADDRHVDRGDGAALARAPARRRGAGTGRTTAPRQRGSLGGKCMPISPAPIAPSTASVSACSPTSASECPTSADARAGSRRRRSMTWSPGPNGCTSKPWPTRTSPSRAASSRSAAARSCGVVTFRLSSLPATITGAMPGRLGDRGVVGQRRARRRRDARRGSRRNESPAASAPATAAERSTVSRITPSVDPLDRVAERQRRDRRRRAVERVDDPVDQRRVGKRPRAVMDQHAVGLVRRQRLEPEPHRILPLGAARHRRQQVEARRRRWSNQRAVLRPDHDLHAGDPRMRRERRRPHGAARWPPPSGEVLLRQGAAEPGAAAGGDNESVSGGHRLN